MDVVRIKSDGKGIRFPSPLRTIVQRCKHYPHEPYRKVKSGLNTATAMRPAPAQYCLSLNRWRTIAPLMHAGSPSLVSRHYFQRS